MPGSLNDKRIRALVDMLLHPCVRLEGERARKNEGFEFFDAFEQTVLNSVPAPETRVTPQPRFGSRPAVLKGGKPFPWMRNT